MMTMSQVSIDKDQSRRSSTTHRPPQLQQQQQQDQNKEQQTCDTIYIDSSKLNTSSQRDTNRSKTQLSDNERIIIVEIDKCFKNWFEPWKRTFLNDGPEYSAVFDLMEGLLHYEKQLLSSDTVLARDRLNAIAQAVARLIDYGNAILNIDITIRANDGTFREVDPASMTTIELYKAHIEAHKLREKLLQNYFKTKTRNSNTGSRASGDNDSPTQSFSFQSQATFLTPSTLRLTPLSASSSNLPSPNMERSQRFSIGSNSSINTIVPNHSSTGSINDGGGRRTPQQLSSAYIEVQTMSSTEDLSESQQEMRHMVATLKSSAFSRTHSTRVTLLLAALAKIESLLSSPTNTEKLTHCFKLLDTLLDSMEKIPQESRKDEVKLIANSILKTLVRKVYIDDRDNYVEFQHSHWTTYLLSLIRLMSVSDFNQYLRSFSNLPDLGAFLKDYLFIIKRLISKPDNEDKDISNILTLEEQQQQPVYPECWVEMSLVVCSTFLKSLTFLYQTLRQYFGSNLQIWSSYIDCLIHFLLQDILKPDKPMLKERQVLLADDLRKTCADYVWITWDSLSCDQKNRLLDNIIEPLLRACIQLKSRQRSILLPIFYDMMQCDYTSQYVSPSMTAATTTTTATIRGNHNTELKLSSQSATMERLSSQAEYIYADARELAARSGVTLNTNANTSGGSGDSQLQLLTSVQVNNSLAATSHQSPLERVNSDESLPYLSLRDIDSQSPPPPPSAMLINAPKGLNNHNITSATSTSTAISHDGTVLTKFTHLIIGKLYNLMMESNHQQLGDQLFKEQLCSAISGELLNSSYNMISTTTTTTTTTNSNQIVMMEGSFKINNEPQHQASFKSMAKHTANLISEFIQICLDSRQANKLSYNHLHLLCLFKLILFFRDKVDRVELYLANLHKLWRLHHTTGRYIEAGFTLLEHAKTLPWSRRPLESHYRILTRSFHQQADHQLSDYMNLKLFLYTTIIEYFDQGQLWEAAVPLCRELIDIYQYRLMDYENLAQMLTKLASFFQNISTNGGAQQTPRSHPEYFRVSFYGLGFPSCLRNSTMIYRGKPFEKLSDFQATILSKYPDAKLLKTLDDPEESLLNNGDVESKYLQINACQPVVNLQVKLESYMASLQMTSDNNTHLCSTILNNEPLPKPLPQFIIAYYKYNECDKFEFSRRLNLNDHRRRRRRQLQHQTTTTSSNKQSINHNHNDDPLMSSKCTCRHATATPPPQGDDFANMWRQRITMSSNSLPGMLPFFIVYLQETQTISPIECAIEDLERANDRLAFMVNRFKADKRHEEDVRPLGQLLLGIVDAAVNGGITKYEQAFFGLSQASAPPPPLKANSNNNININKNSNDTHTQVQLPPLGLRVGGGGVGVTSATTSDDKQQGGSGNNDAFVVRNSIRSFEHNEVVVDKCHQQQQSNNQLELCNHHECCITPNSNDTAAATAASASQIEKLKCLIAGQVPLLDEAIKLHCERVADVMRPQHEHLEQAYKRLKHHIMSKYSRHLPSDYHPRGSTSFLLSSSSSSSPSGSGSNTLRSYRSLARSPNRSIRCEPRIADSANETFRLHSKRMSDVGTRASTRSTVSAHHQQQQQQQNATTTTTTTTANETAPNSFTYRQLNNERRSLPFLSGIGMALNNNNGGGAAETSNNNNLHPPATQLNASLSSPDQLIPPPPPPASFRSSPSSSNSHSIYQNTTDSTYVCMSDIIRSAAPQLQPPPLELRTAQENPYARLLNNDDDDDDDDEDDDDAEFTAMNKLNLSDTNENKKDDHEAKLVSL